MYLCCGFFCLLLLFFSLPLFLKPKTIIHLKLTSKSKRWVLEREITYNSLSSGRDWSIYRSFTFLFFYKEADTVDKLCYVVLCCAIWSYVALFCAMLSALSFTTLCYVMLCSVLCCAMLCYAASTI